MGGQAVVVDPEHQSTTTAGEDDQSGPFSCKSGLQRLVGGQAGVRATSRDHFVANLVLRVDCRGLSSPIWSYVKGGETGIRAGRGRAGGRGEAGIRAGRGRAGGREEAGIR